ncbi:DUF4440 domain-containing protein [Nocardioides litoris]|uniref:nuclear transport factor 2 family protein n=1 Tax=Nocardioides litoris TaxID=1926648 RepID=UPI001B8687A8|nr:nuclear transport factor 2 family protein [Nocardioides litoris]
MTTEARRAAADALLELARSSSYADRGDAGVALVLLLDVPGVATRLAGLVLDPDDTWPTRAVTEALVRRGDTAALGVLAAALPEADDNHADWIAAGIADTKAWAGWTWSEVRATAAALPPGPGAAALASLLGEPDAPDTPNAEDDQVAQVLALERELQTPACRAAPPRLLALLAPDFVEVGASGRVWDRASVLDLLAAEPDSAAAEIAVLDLAGRVVAPGVVQVSWRSERGDRRARRTSLWCRRDGQWQQVAHQGTLL